MRKFSFLLSLVSLAFSVAAILLVSPKGLKQTMVKNPDILIEAGEAAQAYAQEYYENKQQEHMKKVEETIRENIDAYNNDPTAPFVGPEDAEVVVVEFFDFSCGYCRRLAPTLEELVAENKDVKFVFKPLTFLGPQSLYAAKAFIAAKAQDKAYAFYKAALALSPMTEEKLLDAAKKAGIDVAKLKKDMELPEVDAALKNVSELASTAELQGVPFLMINGTVQQTVDKTALQEAINLLKDSEVAAEDVAEAESEK